MIKLENRSNVVAYYHFVNADAFGVFYFDNASGVIPANGFTLVKLTFLPLASINYYKRFYCVVKNGPATPFFLDVMGTGFNEHNRSGSLHQDHVNLFRSLQSSGVAEYPPADSGIGKGGGDGLDDENPQDAEQTLALSERFAQHNTSLEDYNDAQGSPSGNGNTKSKYAHLLAQKKKETNFLKPMNELPVTTADVSLTPQQTAMEAFYPRMDVTMDCGDGMGGSERSIDFHADGSISKSVTITNNFSQKVSAVWMVPGDTRDKLAGPKGVNNPSNADIP